jgi:hypothetical protein
MPTCCVCQGYYPSSKSGQIPECTRCGTDNARWEEAHHMGFHDFIGKVGWYLLIPLIVILVELFFVPAFMFSGGQFRPFAFVLALVLSGLSLGLIGACYVIRFRVREEALLKSVVTERWSRIGLLKLAPAIVLSTAVVVLLLIALAASVFRSGNVFEWLWYNIMMPGPELAALYLYVFLASWVFPTALFVTRRYVGSLDLPQPIYLNLPLMREVIMREYVGKPRGSSLPADLEWRGIKRTARGGLIMTLRQKAADKIIQVEVESDRWARLLRAEEKKEDKSY